MKKLFIAFVSVMLLFGLTACNDTTTDTSVQTTGTTTANTTTSSDTVVYGLPTPATGFYMKDADVIQLEDSSRLLVYTTNSMSGEEENVIAISEGTYDSTNGYAYSAEHVIIQGSESGWDQYLGSASIVKGVFVYESTTYSYLIAYSGTTSISDKSYSIGFAVTNDPLGTWIKVGSAPVVEYDSTIYGSTYTGFYAPSLVNMNEEGIIRLFYTWGDAYGHFTYFVDIDASDLSAMDISGYAMVPNNGNLSSGEDVVMVPNGDFAYDETNEVFFMVKDYSPSASLAPKVAMRIELASIDESELYIAPNPNGWTSLRVYDFEDTPDYAYERVYSGTIVSNAYGHILSSSNIEIVYNVSDLEVDNQYYVFSQHLETFFYQTSN